MKMKATVDIPQSAIDDKVRKQIATLERKLKNAENRAENWKSKAKKLESRLIALASIVNVLPYLIEAAEDADPDLKKDFYQHDRYYI